MDNYKADELIDALRGVEQLLQRMETNSVRFLEVLERAYPATLAPEDEFHTYKVTRPNGQTTTVEARSRTSAAEKVWDVVGNIFEPRSTYKVERRD